MKLYLIAFVMLFAANLPAKEVIDVPLQIVFVDNLSAIPGQIYSNGHPRFLGMYEQVSETCRVNLIKPGDWNDAKKMEILGHEVMHCVWGPHK